MVELELQYLVRLQELDLTSGWPDDLHQSLTSLEETLESLRLGLVLALESADPVNVVPSWQVIEDLLSTVISPGWHDTRRVPNLIPRQLTESELDQWETWANAVHEHRGRSIAVAIRRMLQSISGRFNPDDVLVDAVIVWENLFGAAQETTLRITTSLAWLLGSDANDRERRQKEYKVLYQARSDIVHGSVSAKTKKVPEQSRAAVLVSLGALREVFGRRSELTKLKDGAARSAAVMLNKKPDGS